VEGFYDAVLPLSEQIGRPIAAIPFDEAAYKAQIGVGAGSRARLHSQEDCTPARIG